jgi:enoyl-CoA hydratase/carnithine racemase
MSYQTILYATDGPIATITLNRPAELNTIVMPMPDEIEDAVNTAVRDQSVKVVVAQYRRPVGAGHGDDAHHGSGYITASEIHEHLALAQGGHRAGSRLVCRGAAVTTRCAPTW